MAALMLEPFSLAVEKLYGAAAGNASWREALIAIEDLTGGAGAVIDLIPRVPGLSPRTLSGSFSEENCAEYARDYQAICPRIRHALDHPDQKVQYDYLFMDERDMDRDPVYNWFAKHGLRYFVGGMMGKTPRYFGFFSIQRTKLQGHVDQSGIDMVMMLRPHISHAAALADQLGTLRAERRFGNAVLEAMPQAVFALDDCGRVVFANNRASLRLAARDGLLLESGRLVTLNAADQQSLDAAIFAATNPMSIARGWVKISRPSGAPPLVAFVAPLPRSEEPFPAAQATVLVLLHDPAHQCSARIEMLTSVYGLTATEARLASALSVGHSLDSAAAMLGMKLSTAKSHLKAVFRKTGQSRQQDLVRVMSGMASIVEPNPISNA